MEPQRSQRACKLTENSQELHKKQVRRVEQCFIKSYDNWKAVIKEAKGMLSGECSNSLLHEHIIKVSDTANNRNYVYEELRCIDIPDPETCHRIDTCEAVTKTIIKTAKGYLNTVTYKYQKSETQERKW